MAVEADNGSGKKFCGVDVRRWPKNPSGQQELLGRRMALNAADLSTLSRLLDEALDLPAEPVEVWLADGVSRPRTSVREQGSGQLRG